MRRRSDSRPRRRIGARVATILAALAVMSVLVPAAASDPSGLTLVGSQRLEPRLQELVFRTPALAEDTRVRILYPTGYDRQRSKRYPVLYLLHGCCDDYRSWTDKSDVKALTARLPLIVVMPDAGQAGFYSDWYNFGSFGPPRWEHYHIGQLIPWIDAHLRTIPKRSGRVIAGLSMGGFGAMSYAARHPDLFVAAAAFSGAVNSNDRVGGQAESGLNLLDGAPPDSVWGPRATDEVRWRNHNPWDLAGNLAGLRLTVRTGNGMYGGPYNKDPGYDPVEGTVHDQSVQLHDRLTSLGLPHVWEDYGPGNHGWPYWSRDLAKTLPDLMRALTNPPAPPVPFTYTTAEPAFSIYGWSVVMRRAVMEFSELRAVRPTGFELGGSGMADIVTAPWYEPKAVYRVSVGDGSATSLRADARGRLAITVPLGPDNVTQAYTPPAAATTQVYRTRVSIEGPARAAGDRIGSSAATKVAGRRLAATGESRGPVPVGMSLLAAALLLAFALRSTIGPYGRGSRSD